MSTTAWAARPKGLLAQWEFDEGKGDIARDSSGRGHHAKIYGASWVRQGDGFAISLDGHDDYVDCGKNQALGIRGPITVEAWIKPMRKAHGLACLLGTDLHTYLLTYSNTETCNFFIKSGSNGLKQNPLTIGRWNHVVATFDGDRMKMWVNGRNTGDQKSKFKSYEIHGNFMIATRGREDLPHFKGLVDNVRVYNRAISGKEARAHFHAEAGEHDFDPKWFTNVRATPYYYLHGEKPKVVVEVDYKWLQPLQGAGRLEVTLSNASSPKKIILQRSRKPVPVRSGIVEVSLPCDTLRPGRYVISVAFADDHGAFPTERFRFSYPPKPLSIVSPEKEVVGALPPKRKPTRFNCRVGKGGGFEVKVKGVSYPFVSRISWPDGEFNYLTPKNTPYRKGEKAWKVRVQRIRKGKYKVNASGKYYKLKREIEVFPTHVYVKDTYINATNNDLGLLIYNETPVKPGQITQSFLSGYDKRGRQVDLPYPDYGPSTFFADANTGMGIVPTDDVFIVQAMPYADWHGAAGVRTDKFALGPRKSYTLEWAVYPTDSKDYYDFINTFRKVEGRISTVHGAIGYITASPRNRRQVVGKKFVKTRNLKIGICTNLSYPVDDPSLSIEGIEFPDFPKEMALLKKQTSAIHALNPGLKIIVHIAHSLYCTNNPDRFADSKAIRADGKQATWGDGKTYFGKKRGEEGWQFWIFYPTPGNSFHDAMMKSVDVLMDEMGFDGGLLDGFLAGYISHWSYDTNIRWDGHSAEIDPRTKTIKRKMNSVILLSQPSMIEYARKIHDKGGVVIGMHTVFTRSIAKQKNIIFANECATGPQLHLAPNLTVLSATSVRSEKDLYLDTLDKLSWGELIIYYTMLDLSHTPLAAKEYPMTFEEIRSGLVKGPERIVTMNPGVYGWHGDRRLHLIHKFDGRGAPVPNDFVTTIDRTGVRTELKFLKNESAVIEPIPVVLETEAPVNARVVRYDADELRLLLNGRGAGILRVRPGLFAVKEGASYRVAVGDATRTVAEENGALSVPLNLNGQVEVVVEPPKLTLNVRSAPIKGVTIMGTPSGATDYSAAVNEDAEVILNAPVCAGDGTAPTARGFIATQGKGRGRDMIRIYNPDGSVAKTLDHFGQAQRGSQRQVPHLALPVSRRGEVGSGG